MSDYILKEYPEREELVKAWKKESHPEFVEVNAHLHTPYSFSAFESIEQIFEQAKIENIKALGINDFYSTKGFDEFYRLSLLSGIFPLFNLELVGLLYEEQQKGFRINDPNNPGRIYISGKGLDYPFELDPAMECMLHNIRYEIQLHVKDIAENAGRILKKEDGRLSLKFSEIKRLFARDFVTERHVARAVRSLIYEKIPGDSEKEGLLRHLLGNTETVPDLDNLPAVENEIRTHFLKSGGKAFVREAYSAFLPLDEVTRIILNAGGIPCYSVLLDDESGQCTEYESSKQILLNELRARNIHCIEFLPSRNDPDILADYARFFRQNGFLILFGTAHSTPDPGPLRVTTRGGLHLNHELATISYEGACVVAAHQYYRARGRQGYLDLDGKADTGRLDMFIETGKSVIHRYTAG